MAAAGILRVCCLKVNYKFWIMSEDNKKRAAVSRSFVLSASAKFL